MYYYIEILFVLLNFILALSTDIKIPIYIKNTTSFVDLIIPLNNMVSIDNIIKKFCKKYLIIEPEYDIIRKTVMIFMENIRENPSSFCKSFKINGLIILNFAYEQSNYEIISLTFKIQDNDIMMKLKLSSFCSKFLIDHVTCNELYSNVKNCMKIPMTNDSIYISTGITASTTSIDYFVNEILTQVYDNYQHHHLYISYPKVYYAILAGRMQFLRIHLEYCNILLKLNYITEVHIWDFIINKDDQNDDKEFINQFIRDTDLHGYRLFQNSNNNNNNYRYQLFYEHYLNNKRYQNNDILIKADDDIVFIDISYFPQFIKKVMSYNDKNNDYYFHFPNIINNDVGFLIQAQRIKNKIFEKWLNYYRDNFDLDFNSCLNTYYENVTSMVDFSPITTWNHGIHTKGEFAVDIHTMFVNNLQNFIETIHNNNNKQSKIIKFKRSISNNMYAVSFKTIHKVYKVFLDDYCCNHEIFFGLLPWLMKTSHLIHVDFIISHFAFNFQYKDEIYRSTLESILDIYRDISINFVNTFEKEKPLW